MGERRIRVDLWNHKGNTLLHAERAGVIDHHGTRPGDGLTPLLRDRTTGRGQNKIDTLEGVSRHLLNGQGLAVPLLRGARRAG